MKPSMTMQVQIMFKVKYLMNGPMQNMVTMPAEHTIWSMVPRDPRTSFWKYTTIYHSLYIYLKINNDIQKSPKKNQWNSEGFKSSVVMVSLNISMGWSNFSLTIFSAGYPDTIRFWKSKGYNKYTIYLFLLMIYKFLLVEHYNK